MNTSTNPRLKKVPLNVTSAILEIVNRKCPDILDAMDKVDELLKANFLEIADTEINVNTYNLACTELIMEKANYILQEVLLFQNAYNDFENKALLLKRTLSRAKLSVMSLEIDIKDNDELDEICRLYHRDYAIFIAKHFIKYQNQIDTLIELPVEDERFIRPLNLKESFDKRIKMYIKAVEMSGFKEKFFPFTILEGENSIHNAAKKINMSIIHLNIKLLSNNKQVISNFFNLCERRNTYNINLINDMNYSKEDVENSLFKPVTQTLNSTYDNLLRAPHLIDDIKRVVDILLKSYYLIKKESNLGLCYDPNSLANNKVEILHFKKAKYLYEQLKKYGRKSDFLGFELALSRSNQSYSSLKLRRDSVAKLVKKDIRLI
jgi:hypothetical protein